MKTYTIDEMKRAFDCGRQFQLTAENNFQELIEELNQVNKISANHNLVELATVYKPKTVMFAANGNVAVYDSSDKQIPELNVSWITTWLHWAETQGCNPADIEIVKTTYGDFSVQKMADTWCVTRK